MITLSAPAAVMWDMDGTLVDTEDHWADAFAALARDAGHQPSRDELDALRGLTTDAVASRLIPLTGDTLDGARAALETSVSDLLLADMPYMPGAVELVRTFAELNIPQAIVTASNRATTAPVADAFAKLISPAGAWSFAAVITDEDVRAGKPHPEPYATAAARLDVNPSEAVAFEDSTTGATSALAAGLTVITIGAHVDAQTLPMRPSRHVSSLTEVHISG